MVSMGPVLIADKSLECPEKGWGFEVYHLLTFLSRPEDSLGFMFFSIQFKKYLFLFYTLYNKLI